MPFISVGIVLGLLVALGLAIALAITFASPIIALPIFIVAFGAFLIWRGSKRTERGGEYAPSRVPTTEAATADPVQDSGAGEAAAGTVVDRERQTTRA